MALVRISDPDLLATLVSDLNDRADIVATVLDDDLVNVSILGSYNGDALRVATYLRIRAWEAAQHARGHDVRVELE
jgi:hypothetical protein